MVAVEHVLDLENTVNFDRHTSVLPTGPKTAPNFHLEMCPKWPLPRCWLTLACNGSVVLHMA